MGSFKRFGRPLRRALRHALAGAALTGLLASTVGLPVLEYTGRDIAGQFPCQGRSCGCATAEACWRGCCCFSPVDRVAWARAHGVHPPEELLAEARATVSTRRNVTSHKSCCQKHRAVADPRSVAGRQQEHREQCVAPSGSEPLCVRWVIGSLVSRCRGLHYSLSSGPDSLPPPPAVSWSFDWQVVAIAPDTLLHFSSLSIPPPSPPPKLASARA